MYCWIEISRCLSKTIVQRTYQYWQSSPQYWVTERAEIVIQVDVFPQKEPAFFLAENMVEGYIAKQSEWKFLVGRLPRMEPQEIFKRKKIGSKPDKHEVHFKILLLEINM